MNKKILIGAGLLLSIAGIGVVLAAADFDVSSGHRQERHDSRATADAQGNPIHTAEESHGGDHGGAHHGRSPHDDEDEDDDDNDNDNEGAGRGAIPQNGPSDPKASVPDNGLFNGKARPKVEVQ